MLSVPTKENQAMPAAADIRIGTGLPLPSKQQQQQHHSDKEKEQAVRSIGKSNQNDKKHPAVACRNDNSSSNCNCNCALDPSTPLNTNTNNHNKPTTVKPNPRLNEQIQCAFELCRENGRILRSDPSSPLVQTRILPGHFHLVAKFQPCLLSRKRAAVLPPEVSMNQPFQKDQFHFNLVKEEEVLLRLVSTEDKEQQEQHKIVANVSPLMPGHSLLLPWPHRCLTQRLTPEAVDLVFDILLHSTPSSSPLNPSTDYKYNSNNDSKVLPFRMGFNSLGAFSSVNHLHIHFLYPGDIHHQGFPIEQAPIQCTLSKTPYCQVDVLDWMVPCFSFCVPSSSTRQEEEEDFSCRTTKTKTTCAAMMRNKVVQLLTTLYQSEIPHNVLFVPPSSSPSPTKNHTSSPSPSQTYPRVIIIPRKPQHVFPSTQAGFNAALGEICGYLIGKSSDKYEGFCQEEVERWMKECVGCSQVEFGRLRKEFLGTE